MTECSLPCVGHIDGPGKTWFHLCTQHVENVHPFNLTQETTVEISSNVDSQAAALYAAQLSKKGTPLASLKQIHAPLGETMTHTDIIQ
jgi:hypothetical protein